MLWSMDAAFCFTLAGIYLLVWCKQREGWMHLLFSCSALAAGVIAGFELTSMRAETAAQYGAVLRWGRRCPFRAALASSQVTAPPDVQP